MPQIDDLVRRPAAQFLAIKQDGTVAGVDQARQRQQRGRLAGAIGAEQSGDLPQFQGEIDALDRFDGAVVDLQILDFKQDAHDGLFTAGESPSSSLAQISFDDIRIGANRLRRALGDELAEIEHGDFSAKAHDETHVMLDDQHAQATLFELDDLIHELLLLRAVHARRRFIEQQQLGRRRQRPGDLQAALLAVGKFARQDFRLIGQPDSR